MGMGGPGMPMGMPRMGMPGMPGQPPIPGMPPMMMQHAPPAAENEPASKKAKTTGPEGGGGGLLPEAQFLAMNPGPVNVQVQMPDDRPEFNCNGQTVSYTLKPTDTVDTLKQHITNSNNGMPGSKMKLNFMNGIFLNKDKMSMAHYNVRNGTTFQLGVRERGGRKK